MRHAVLLKVETLHAIGQPFKVDGIGAQDAMPSGRACPNVFASQKPLDE